MIVNFKLILATIDLMHFIIFIAAIKVQHF